MSVTNDNQPAGRNWVLSFVLGALWASTCAGLLWLTYSPPERLVKPSVAAAVPQERANAHPAPAASTVTEEWSYDCLPPEWFASAHGIRSIRINSTANRATFVNYLIDESLWGVKAIVEKNKEINLPITERLNAVSPGFFCENISYLRVSENLSFLTIDPSHEGGFMDGQVSWIVTGKSPEIARTDQKGLNLYQLQSSDIRTPDGGYCVVDVNTTVSDPPKSDVWCEINNQLAIQESWFQMKIGQRKYSYQCNRLAEKNRLKDADPPLNSLGDEVIQAMQTACDKWAGVN